MGSSLKCCCMLRFMVDESSTNIIARIESSSYLLVSRVFYLGYAYSNAHQVKLAEQNEKTRGQEVGEGWGRPQRIPHASNPTRIPNQVRVAVCPPSSLEANRSNHEQPHEDVSFD